MAGQHFSNTNLKGNGIIGHDIEKFAKAFKKSFDIAAVSVDHIGELHIHRLFHKPGADVVFIQRQPDRFFIRCRGNDVPEICFGSHEYTCFLTNG
jgi:hypothetical protein